MYATTVDIPFSSNSRPRARLDQQGSSDQHLVRPSRRLLHEYQQVAMYDPTLRSGLHTLTSTLCSTLGEIWHPDDEIKQFLRYNHAHMADQLQVDPFERLQQMVHNTLWAGYSVTEKLMTRMGNGIGIEDFITYHPATITIRPNKRGRLTENEQVDGRITGIFQNNNIEPEAQLNLWKVVRLCQDGQYNNYYGRSVLEAAYKYVLIKEAYIDMMSLALDRFGTPMFLLTVPNQTTQETVLDPTTGKERALSAREVAEQQVSRLGSNGNVLVLTQTDPNFKPDVKAITTGNNIGSSFLDAIRFCDQQISRSILTPFLLVSEQSESSGTAERQMELFNRVIWNMHRQFIRPICAQSWYQLVQWNFNRESAKIPPSYPIRQITRAEDRLTLMQMIRGATEDAYLVPSHEADWSASRQMMGLPDREQTDEDRKFIYDMLIAPKQKPVAAGDPKRDRSREGKIRGKAKQGRPPGIVAPKDS